VFCEPYANRRCDLPGLIDRDDRAEEFWGEIGRRILYQMGRGRLYTREHPKVITCFGSGTTKMIVAAASAAFLPQITARSCSESSTGPKYKKRYYGRYCFRLFISA